MGIWTIVYLLIAGVGAGLTSTTVGMASLVSYPVLLSIGLTPIGANVTNTAAMIATGLGSGLSSLPELRAHKTLTWQVTGWALGGGIVGSLILVIAPAESFEKIVPMLVLLAAVLMLSTTRTKPAAATQPTAPATTHGTWWRNAAIFGVGAYIGYFGASAGMIFLAVLSATLTVTLPVSNAIKNFAILVTNIMSLTIYAMNTTIAWAAVVPLGLGMFVGGYLGPIVFRQVPAQLMKWLIGVAALILAGVLAAQAYF